MSKPKNRLWELRANKGHSLKKLSIILSKEYNISVSPSQLLYYEKGEREPRNKEVWYKLAEYFNVPVTYLLGYDDKLTIGDTLDILEAVESGDISSDDEVASQIIREQKESIKRTKEIAKKAYEKYKDFDLVSNIKVFTLLLEHCDSIYTDIIRYVTPRLVQNELTEKELKSLNAFINLLEEHGKEFKDTADSFSKRLNTKSETTPNNND